MSNLNFSHSSQWITLPTKSYLVLYSFCANLSHSLIMWLIVSSLSPHNLHLLFCYVLSILGLIWLVLMALFCAAIRRNSISLLRFYSIYNRFTKDVVSLLELIHFVHVFLTLSFQLLTKQCRLPSPNSVFFKIFSKTSLPYCFQFIFLSFSNSFSFFNQFITLKCY